MDTKLSVEEAWHLIQIEATKADALMMLSRLLLFGQIQDYYVSELHEYINATFD